MASSGYADIISRPPFYSIEGVNPTAPIPAQMEQIDQLNTLLLQEIDANFAHLHQVVTSKILPEIKRFAIANQPTREAAAFWRNFYLQAFGERPGEGSTIASHSPERTRYEDQTHLLSGSFFDPPPGSASTPLRQRGRDEEDSYEDSLGSPFDRVDRQLSRLSMDTGDAPTPSLPSGYSVPGGRSPDSSPEYDSTLRFQAASTPRPARNAAAVREEEVSPTLHRSPATRLIDLTSTPLGTDFRPLAPSAHTGRSLFRLAPKPSTSTSQPARHLYDDDDDIKLGMSPPVTMKFSLPPAAQSIVDRGTTPIKAHLPSGGQTARDLDDLIDNMSDYEPSPRMPTPKDLRRYSVAPGDSDLEAVRRLWNEPVQASTSSAREPSSSPSPPPLRDPSPARRLFDDSTYGAHRTRRSLANTSFGSDIEIQRDVTGRIIGDDESIDVDDDFSEDDTAGYAAQAAQGFEFVDNSYDSDASGYSAPRDTDTVGRGAGETSLFGKPAPSGVQGGQGRWQGQGQGRFSLHQQDEMVTYHGGRLEDADAPDSPTRRR